MRLALVCCAIWIGLEPCARAQDTIDPRSVRLPDGDRWEPLSPSPRVEVGGARPLRLDEVIDSALRAHPTLAGARSRVRAAEGERLAAEGGFDLGIAASGWAAPIGYYEWGRADLTVTQPTPLWGATFYGGWRIGRPFENDDAPGIPIYYRGYETLEYGEIRAGVRVPLWQDGPIDARRARLWRAEHGVVAEEGAADARTLTIRLEAARAYFQWVAAARRYQVSAELLDLAEQRDAQIASRAAAGAIPPLEPLENRRVILARRQALVSARRGLEQAAIALSLFWRDAHARPIVPTADRAPLELPPPEPPRISLRRAIRDAWRQRPETERYRALLRRQRVSLDQAHNRFAPRIDVLLEASADLGSGNERQTTSLGPPVLEAAVVIGLPLQFREARGEIDRARGELGEIEAAARLLRDTIAAEVQDAASALVAAEEAVELAREGLRVAQAVAAAEQRRFELGATELFVVNQREQSAAEAAGALVDAEAALHIAHARWRAATGASD